MVDGLGISKNKVHIGFAVVCITSPTGGAVLSGFLSNKFIGTNDRKVVPFLLVITFLATASASPLWMASIPSLRATPNVEHAATGEKLGPVILPIIVI